MKSVKEKKLLICSELYKKKIAVTNEIIKDLWQQWYPADMPYYIENPDKWESCCRWIINYLGKHDLVYIERAIQNQRKMQKRTLNKALESYGAHVVLVKDKIKNGKLAMYLMIRNDERKTGSFTSLMAYIKSLDQE